MDEVIAAVLLLDDSQVGAFVPIPADEPDAEDETPTLPDYVPAADAPFGDNVAADV